MLTCKVYYSLLALSYLEVVLWSSCLIVSLLSTSAVSTADSQQYLARETVNLECLVGRTTQSPLKAAQYSFSNYVRLLLKHKIQVFLDWSLHNLHCTGLTQESLEPLKGLLLCNLEAQEGLPAPYTGVKAIV